MHKIRYESDLYAMVFFFIGIAFLVFSFLTGEGLVKPTSHSMIQDPKQIQNTFLLVSAVSFFTCAACKFLTLRGLQREKRLMEEGVSLLANVEEVRELRGIRLKGRKPYVILYNFNLEGFEYRGKSRLFWERPELREGSRIQVLADERGRSVVV